MSNAYLPHAAPRYMATTRGERAESALHDLDRLADKLRALAGMDPDEAATIVEDLERLAVRVATALREETWG